MRFLLENLLTVKSSLITIKNNNPFLLIYDVSWSLNKERTESPKELCIE